MHGTRRLDADPKVAWIAHQDPRGMLSGRDVYSAELLNSVAAGGAGVTFFGIADRESGPQQTTAAEPQIDWQIANAPERRTVAALASPLPFNSARISPAELSNSFHRWLSKHHADVIVFDHCAAGWALEIVHRASARKPFLVYIAHNDEAALAGDIATGFRGDPLRKLALQVNARKVRRLEDRLLNSVDLVATLTSDDAAALMARSGRQNAIVIPPGYGGKRRQQRVIDRETPRRAIMLGSVRWIAKRMNVAEFLAAADAKLAAAGIEFDIIGDVADDFKAEWEPKLLTAKFRGFAADLGREMDGARLGLVIETTGGGFKLKTLDYVFHRVPVAALAGSLAGIPEAVKRNFVLADDPEMLAARIIETIDDLPRLNEMQDEAFTAASGLFDWTENGRRLLNAMTSSAMPAH